MGERLQAVWVSYGDNDRFSAELSAEFNTALRQEGCLYPVGLGSHQQQGVLWQESENVGVVPPVRTGQIDAAEDQLAGMEGF